VKQDRSQKSDPIKTTIWWIRRDLRLADNPALAEAIRIGEQVLPVFILDQKLLHSSYTGEKRLAFLFANLRCLDQSLRQHGSRLIIRQGDPVEELAKLTADLPGATIFAEPDYSPYALKRDLAVSGNLSVQWIGSPAAQPPGSVLRNDGAPYTVFTPFSRAWKANPQPIANNIIPIPARISTPERIHSLEIPSSPILPGAIPFLPGEKEAQKRLNWFIEGSEAQIYQYNEQRNRPDLDGTSRLSAYFRFGILSARQAVVAALTALQYVPDATARQSAETWLNELIWREFYIHILYHFPQVRRKNFRLENIPWQDNPDDFAAWCEGRTGYPIVDAAMRQLVHTGWMHNRTRMITASFLTKDLLIDWRWGERFFMQHLVDGDPAANNGGWQWTAGTGTDAAPYFRVFNPTLQGIKFDPHGQYIRRWLPELETVPDEHIHEPWKMPGDLQESVGCRIGKDYPGPIIDHHFAKERVLAAYSKAKSIEIIG
jgi:deoxyribodipyrimidine photo-lyase